MANLGSMLLEKFAGFADAPALDDLSGALTYRALSQAALNVERTLRNERLVADEPVLVPVANEARDAAALVGVWLAGGVAVPVARHAPASAIELARAATGARFSVTNTADELVHRVADHAPPHRALLGGAALIVFTSGSTGRPKGVVLSHRAFSGKLEAIDSMLGFTPRTRTLLVLQISFVFGMWVLLLTLLKGGTVAMHARFEPLHALAALKDERISDVALVPTMLRKFLALDESTSAPLIAASTLERILTGGEPFGRMLSTRLQRLMPDVRVVDIYGLTETCSSDFFLTAEKREAFAETIGRPGPGVRFRIADDQGRELPTNVAGELQIRTPFAMSGYLDDPDQTRAAFADDYFRTGDLARARADGRVELAGRIKDLIYRGGAKVSPLELDHILAQHPAVAAALTTGVPDPIMGERIHALVVPRPNAAIDEEELREWIAGRIEKFKWPDVYHFGAELPAGRTGKVDRNALREQVVRAGSTAAG
ncbi:MAG TPA: fatty acid--CoA ligase family protein [Xanthobacteraceae bacterium]|nr:fatty acid--CoA ligase family protein [Xanthobacteraceae bacterium]